MARKARINHEHVIDTAAGLVNQHGLHRVSLAMLAAELKIRTPSLYNHIDGLAGLHYSLALRGVQELTRAVTKAVLGKAGIEAVQALATAYRRYILKAPGVYAATSLGPQLMQAGDELQQASDELVEIIATILTSVAAIEPEARIHAVRGLRSLVHGFTTLEAAQSFGLPTAIEASFQWLLTTFVQGLGSQTND